MSKQTRETAPAVSREEYIVIVLRVPPPEANTDVVVCEAWVAHAMPCGCAKRTKKLGPVAIGVNPFEECLTKAKLLRPDLVLWKSWIADPEHPGVDVAHAYGWCQRDLEVWQ